MSSQQQLTSLSTQVSGLAEINKTLKKYLEALLVSEAPKKSRELIDNEAKRLEKASKAAILRKNSFIKFLHDEHNLDVDIIYNNLLKFERLNDFLDNVAEETGKTEFLTWKDSSVSESDYWDSRRYLGLSVIPSVELSTVPAKRTRSTKKVSLARKARTSKKATSSKK